jgi:hypothetical protein
MKRLDDVHEFSTIVCVFGGYATQIQIAFGLLVQEVVGPGLFVSLVGGGSRVHRVGQV